MVRHFLNEPKITLQISWPTETEFGYVWKGSFDFNTLHLEVEIFKSEVESFRIKLYPKRLCMSTYMTNGIDIIRTWLTSDGSVRCIKPWILLA